MKRPLHTIIASILLSLLLLPLSVSVHASGEMLQTVHDVKLLVFETAASFHKYQGSEGDPQNRKIVNENVESLKNGLTSVENMLGELSLEEEKSALKSNWTTMSKNLSVAMAAIKRSGFAEFQVIDSYLTTSDEIVNALNLSYESIKEATGYKVPPTVQNLRELTITMERMTAMYIELANSQFGAVNRSSQENADTIDTLAARFTKGLDKLKAETPSTSELYTKISKIQTKWGFLVKSFQNYTEKTVPYLVTKFGRQITSELNSIASKMEKQE